MTVELARTVLIYCGFMIIGLNLAIIAEAPRLVTAVGPWRLYMGGQCMFVLACIYGLHKHLHAPIGVTVYLVAAAIFTTLLSLILLERSYHRKLETKQRLARVGGRYR
jgi:hypothetical protein